MKVFIVGATGVLGRATVPALVAAGHQVRGLARSPEKAAQLRAKGAEATKACTCSTLPAFATPSRGVEAVVHMATSIPPMTKAWRLKAWATNDRLRREATPILVDAAHQPGATRFVKESVCFFYMPRGDSWIDESDPIDRQSFAEATLAAEDGALAFGDGQGDRRGVALRFGMFYSAEARGLDECLTVAKLGFGPMVGRPGAYQPSIHVADAASAVVAALDAPPGPTTWRTSRLPRASGTRPSSVPSESTRSPERHPGRS